MPTPANPTPPERSTAASRGRNAASKPLNAAAAPVGASSKSKTVVSGPSADDKPPRTLSESTAKSSTSVKSAKVSSGSTVAASSTSRASASDTGFTVTKLSSSTVTINSSWTPKPISEQPKFTAVASTFTSNVDQTNNSDPLQLAAQVYPWAYMSSTLDACFQNAETTAKNDIEIREKELNLEEAEVTDMRDRLEAGRAIEFYDELGSDTFVKDAPAIMKLFHSHGESCDRIESEALKLAMRSPPDPPEDDPLQVYQDMLHDLEELHTEAIRLQESILKLTQGSTPSVTNPISPETEDDVSSARSQITGVFAACLPVLRARIANLSMAQDLIDSALENVSLGLRMESMGLND